MEAIRAAIGDLSRDGCRGRPKPCKPGHLHSALGTARQLSRGPETEVQVTGLWRRRHCAAQVRDDTARASGRIGQGAGPTKNLRNSGASAITRNIRTMWCVATKATSTFNTSAMMLISAKPAAA